MHEKPRRHRRVEASLLLYVEQLDGQGRMRMNTVGQVLNLSEGGLLAEVCCPVEPGLEPSLLLALGGECLELRTRLARTERMTPSRYRLAFQLDRRARRARMKIAEFVQARLGALVAVQAA